MSSWALQFIINKSPHCSSFPPLRPITCPHRSHSGPKKTWSKSVRWVACFSAPLVLLPVDIPTESTKPLSLLFLGLCCVFTSGACGRVIGLWLPPLPLLVLLLRQTLVAVFFEKFLPSDQQFNLSAMGGIVDECSAQASNNGTKWRAAPPGPEQHQQEEKGHIMGIGARVNIGNR